VNNLLNLCNLLNNSNLLNIPRMAVVTVIAVAILRAADDTGSPRYTVQDLGTLGGTFSLAGGLNNKGQVDGFASLAGSTPTHAFLWRKGIMTDLGTLGGPNSFANSRPSEKGEVGGAAETKSPDPNGENFCSNQSNHMICQPFVWQKGAMTALPTLGGNNGAVRGGLNNHGQAVGVAENTTKDPTCVAPQVLQFKPVIWHKDWDKDDVQELPTLLGDPDGVALAINDEGQATGQTGNCALLGDGFFTANQILGAHAVLWQREEVEFQNEDDRVHWTVTDLGSLGGAMNNAGQALNHRGQVVGNSDLVGDKTGHAFLWEDGVMRDLGTLPGDFSSGANSINDEGQVVGGSADINGKGRAFLWQDDVMTDLNTLIPKGSHLILYLAFEINSRGQIAGLAFAQKGTGSSSKCADFPDLSATCQLHGFLATPVDDGGDN
jgi:probable HAF family extracellular repeat protein